MDLLRSPHHSACPPLTHVVEWSLARAHSRKFGLQPKARALYRLAPSLRPRIALTRSVKFAIP